MPQKKLARPVLDLPFEEAVRFALSRHRLQARKGTEIPYMAHLLQVTGIVLEAGGTEEQAVAALLHDCLEDARREDVPMLRSAIRSRFGERVLDIVEALTDSEGEPKPPWKERKQRYLSHLGRERDPAVLLVACADKLHNASAIVRDLKTHGPDVWTRFEGKREGTLWYYAELVKAIHLEHDTPVLRDLAALVAELHELARHDPV